MVETFNIIFNSLDIKKDDSILYVLKEIKEIQKTPKYFK